MRPGPARGFLWFKLAAAHGMQWLGTGRAGQAALAAAGSPHQRTRTVTLTAERHGGIGLSVPVSLTVAQAGSESDPRPDWPEQWPRSRCHWHGPGGRTRIIHQVQAAGRLNNCDRGHRLAGPGWMAAVEMRGLTRMVWSVVFCLCPCGRHWPAAGRTSRNLPCMSGGGRVESLSPRG